MDMEAQMVIHAAIERQRRLAVLLFVIVVARVASYYHNLLLSEPEPEDTILTGEEWILELLNGHPDRIKVSLGVNHNVFNALVQVLVEHGFERSRRGISVEQQLGIFLHTCVTGLSTSHVGERFQHSSSTISRYFKLILEFFSSNPFYSTYVKLPAADAPKSTKITDDPHFRFFADCIGAIDGAHIRAFVPVDNHPTRNHQGFISQNCLFVCDFDLNVIYSMTGWGSLAGDATMWNNAHSDYLHIPPGKYLLADAGFNGSDALLVPYRGVRYHLKEWRQTNQSPRNKKELFNLRHARLRSMVERNVGIVKRHWRILLLSPEFDMDVQARIPAALIAIHNFIQEFDPDMLSTQAQAPESQPEAPRLERTYGNDGGPAIVPGDLAEGPVAATEQQRADVRRDNIAKAMWQDYCCIARERGMQTKTAKAKGKRPAPAHGITARGRKAKRARK